MFTKNHIQLAVVDSTNVYTLKLRNSPLFKEGLVVSAAAQHKGKGQRGETWESEDAKNCILSIVISPNIAVEKQFELSKLVSLAVYDLLSSYTQNVSIKWPNDILIGKEKAAGILIQNILKGDEISYAVIGIGLNINQLEFQPYLRKATSLSLATNIVFDTSAIQQELLTFLEKRYKNFKNGVLQNKAYLDALYLHNKVAAFEADNKKFMGIIRGVTDNGKLLIEKDDDSLGSYSLKELKFLS